MWKSNTLLFLVKQNFRLKQIFQETFTTVKYIFTLIGLRIEPPPTPSFPNPPWYDPLNPFFLLLFVLSDPPTHFPPPRNLDFTPPFPTIPPLIFSFYNSFNILNVNPEQSSSSPSCILPTLTYLFQFTF